MWYLGRLDCKRQINLPHFGQFIQRDLFALIKLYQKELVWLNKLKNCGSKVWNNWARVKCVAVVKGD